MNFIVDESVDYPLVIALRDSGHVVYSVLEDLPGAKDEEVLRVASERKAPLITKDKDFGELVYRLRKITSGVILLRFEGMTRQQQIQTIHSAISQHENEFQGAFVVIANNNIRIRRIALLE